MAHSFVRYLHYGFCTYIMFILRKAYVICSISDKSESFNVALIGDSLIHRPVDDYNLLGKITNLLPSYNLNFSVYAQNGAKILDIKEKQLFTALAQKPDAILLFWDSDCSDVDETNMTTDEKSLLRATYSANLDFVVRHIVASGAYFALGGPEILGEGPVGMPDRFKHKSGMLNDYRDMNKAVAGKYNIRYMDIRQAFLDAIPSYQVFVSGTLYFAAVLLGDVLLPYVISCLWFRLPYRRWGARER